MLETFEKKISENYDSCIVEVPKEFALANGFPAKSFVSLTMKNGILNSEIIKFTDEDEKEIDEFINDFPNLNEELKQIGD
jgi:hypothetical protein